jgi:pimeloyl-ACP methyl ester carboxylesterase
MLRQGIPHSELIVLDGAGHALLQTRAAEVNQALERFLKGGTRGP